MPNGDSKNPDDGFRLNEPEAKIPGGARRKSTRVPRGDLKLVVRREQLNALLLAHDPKDAENAIQQITDADHLLLRQIAREGAITGVSPSLRQNAIAVLGRFPTHDNVNFLAELAQHGEDFYVRSHALVALGNSGSALAAPILREALAAAEPVEVQSAEGGFEALAGRVGIDVVRAAFAGEKRKAIVTRGDQLIARLEGKGTRAKGGKTTGKPSTRPA